MGGPFSGIVKLRQGSLIDSSAEDSKAGECVELQLGGSPRLAGGEEALRSRQLVATILARLRALGWEVAATLDLSRKLNDKTVFVFRQGSRGNILLKSWFGLFSQIHCYISFLNLYKVTISL